LMMRSEFKVVVEDGHDDLEDGEPGFTAVGPEAEEGRDDSHAKTVVGRLGRYRPVLDECPILVALSSNTVVVDVVREAIFPEVGADFIHQRVDIGVLDVAAADEKTEFDAEEEVGGNPWCFVSVQSDARPVDEVVVMVAVVVMGMARGSHGGCKVHNPM